MEKIQFRIRDVMLMDFRLKCFKLLFMEKLPAGVMPVS